MTVVRLDVEGFLARAGAFLVQREAEHNLILGLAARLASDPLLYGSEPPYLAVAERQGAVVAVALRTPPHGLVLSEVDDDRALEELAADVRDVYDSLPSALGPVAAVRRFVELWQTRGGIPGRLAISERIYRAGSVTHPTQVSGRCRPYAKADRELTLRWLAAFVEEALPEGSQESVAGILEHRLADPGGGFVLWEDGEAVSLAGFGGPTPNGIRIGPVYTPPELRGHGYASALVADLTASLLAGGRRFCFLFTNLANPTSNSIYPRVGFEPVTDVDLWLFAASA
jgi:predicted GNAT family acetyltransferase